MKEEPVAKDEDEEKYGPSAVERFQTPFSIKIDGKVVWDPDAEPEEKKTPRQIVKDYIKRSGKE
jgi:hypothetical protein